MYIIIFIAVITITSAETQSMNCFTLQHDWKIDPRIAEKIPDPNLDNFRKSDITKLTPEENKKFGFNSFNKYPNNPTALFIISPDGISKAPGQPLMNFINTDEEFHGIKQITHQSQNKLDAVEIQYEKWLAASSFKTRLIQPLLDYNFECWDLESTTEPLVKRWMQKTLDHAMSLKQNVVWMDAMRSDKYFAEALRKVRKANYQMKFVFVVGDMDTVVAEAEIKKKRAMMQYDKSQYYDSLLLIDDLASDLRSNGMSENMQCIMSNGDDTPIEEIDYETMNQFIKANTKRTYNRHFKSWMTKVGTGITRKVNPFRTDSETQLKKSRGQSLPQVEDDKAPDSGVMSFNNLNSNNGRKDNGKGAKGDSDDVEGVRTTGFLFWLCLTVLTVFMSIFGVIL